MSEEVYYLTLPAFLRAFDFDREAVGKRSVREYSGLAYFWAMDYKFTMREQTPYRRRLIFRKLIEAGLDPVEVSPEHASIIARWASN